MQSYFALIEDVFNTLQGPLWPHYESDETASPCRGTLKHIAMCDKGEHSDLGAWMFNGGEGGIQKCHISKYINNTDKTNRSLTSVKTFDL